MTKSSSVTHEKTGMSKDILFGMIIGGIIGILLGALHRFGILAIPALYNVFSYIPLNEIISATLLGIIIGGFIGAILSLYSPENKNSEYNQQTNSSKQKKYIPSKSATLEIKEEQLNIAKKLIKTGEVKIYREEFTEEKSFTIPVIREELVIEKKVLSSNNSKLKDSPTETIRIPLSEEQVELTKHKVALEDVSIYKQKIQEIKHIEETLKKEEVKVKVSGSPKVTNKTKGVRD
ncbi:YsnF/AvaK domain-containing protein [Clostridium cylindrosporum]|uniref:DUF2382 domain-containing protein n=1 Tax=Clostridium cylindrosporum DSM 605 TaxID=1121307 RepID=A0A0J8DCE7_CLOCY|nr:YsnF/AvaK domain-containing protein [Clostridium cylindrosporum]KMT21928.1 hypothetical protein CLCY_3c01990 [Clostridium cylindrosporum DSM 605]